MVSQLTADDVAGLWPVSVATTFVSTVATCSVALCLVYVCIVGRPLSNKRIKNPGATLLWTLTTSDLQNFKGSIERGTLSPTRLNSAIILFLVDFVRINETVER